MSRIAAFALAAASLIPCPARADTVYLAWDASPSSVAGYIIYYGTSAGSYTSSIDVGNVTTWLVGGLATKTTYYFVVKAYGSSPDVNGNQKLSDPSNEVSEVSSATRFTDEALTTGYPIRAVHLQEIRTRINTLRTQNNLGEVTWTDSTLGTTIAVRAVHITELRAALNEVYTQVKKTPLPSYTDPNLAVGTTIRAAHITELRAAIRAFD